MVIKTVLICLLFMFISIFQLLKVKLKESALVNVNRTDVLSKSIHSGVN